MTIRPEDLMRRLGDPEGPHRAFALEGALLTVEARDLYEADIDFPAVLADMMAVGLMPLNVGSREVMCIISLTLAAQKRIAEGRVTSFQLDNPGVVEAPEPGRASVPDIFKNALDDVDTAGI